MTTPSIGSACNPQSKECHLCGDVAEVGRVLGVDASTRVATVELPDGVQSVAIDFVDAHVGDHVLVHLGFAIERVGAA